MKHSKVANISITLFAVFIGIIPTFGISNTLTLDMYENHSIYNISYHDFENYMCNVNDNRKEIEAEINHIEADYNVTLHEEDVIALSKMLYGEANGVESETERAAVIWCCLNRFDYGDGATIADCASDRNSFNGYHKSNPVTEKNRKLVEDILYRYYIEKQGAPVEEVMRVLPVEYKWFRADSEGQHNMFRNMYDGNYSIWNWSLPSPYET